MTNNFKLSKRSLSNLEGVDSELVAIVKLALKKTTIDFGVTCGLRTIDEQKLLVDSGASQTMKSKHIEGKAVDLVAYLGARISWELSLYDEIAYAMVIAAKELSTPIRWGAAWTINDITTYNGTMAMAMTDYIKNSHKEGKRPFIDAPHFERIEI